jgi:hypothetical protein
MNPKRKIRSRSTLEFQINNPLIWDVSKIFSKQIFIVASGEKFVIIRPAESIPVMIERIVRRVKKTIIMVIAGGTREMVEGCIKKPF